MPVKFGPLCKLQRWQDKPQIIRIIGATMLFRYDVLNMVDEIVTLLVQTAIFTAFAGPSPDEVARCRVHVLLDTRI